MSDAVISIDPGVQGGMALFVRGQPVEWAVMPHTPKDVRKWLEDAITTAKLEGCTPALIVEYQSPMPDKVRTNVKGTANMMRRYGQWEIHALYLGIPYHEVIPAAWKKLLGVTKDKATSIELCERLFPGVDLVQPGCRRKHDGVAEALLIGEAARRMNL